MTDTSPATPEAESVGTLLTLASGLILLLQVARDGGLAAPLEATLGRTQHVQHPTWSKKREPGIQILVASATDIADWSLLLDAPIDDSLELNGSGHWYVHVVHRGTPITVLTTVDLDKPVAYRMCDSEVGA